MFDLFDDEDDRIYCPECDCELDDDGTCPVCDDDDIDDDVEDDLD